MGLCGRNVFAVLGKCQNNIVDLIVDKAPVGPIVLPESGPDCLALFNHVLTHQTHYVEARH